MCRGLYSRSNDSGRLACFTISFSIFLSFSPTREMDLQEYYFKPFFQSSSVGRWFHMGGAPKNYGGGSSHRSHSPSYTYAISHLPSLLFHHLDTVIPNPHAHSMTTPCLTCSSHMLTCHSSQLWLCAPLCEYIASKMRAY